MTNTLLTLHDPEAAQRYDAEEAWRADTLSTPLREHAARRPDDLASGDGTWRSRNHTIQGNRSGHRCALCSTVMICTALPLTR